MNHSTIKIYGKVGYKCILWSYKSRKLCGSFQFFYQTGSNLHGFSRSYSRNIDSEYLNSVSKINYQYRKNLLKHLQKSFKSVNNDVISADGICKTCQKNFYSMELIDLYQMQKFIEFQFNRSEFSSYFYKLKTLPIQRTQEILLKELHVIKTFSETISNARNITHILDEANIKQTFSSLNDGYDDWFQQNRHKIICVSDFHKRFQFKTLAYDKNTRKIYSVTNRYLFPGYDDLICMYLSILFPKLPLVYTFDRFKDHIDQAYLFEELSGNLYFGINFERLLSNVLYQSHSLHELNANRNGFYLTSPCFSTHHYIQNGESFCIS